MQVLLCMVGTGGGGGGAAAAASRARGLVGVGVAAWRRVPCSRADVVGNHWWSPEDAARSGHRRLRVLAGHDTSCLLAGQTRTEAILFVGRASVSQPTQGATREAQKPVLFSSRSLPHFPSSTLNDGRRHGRHRPPARAAGPPEAGERAVCVAGGCREGGPALCRCRPTLDRWRASAWRPGRT